MATIFQDEQGNYSCTDHGDTVLQTIGQWSGRPMAECSECGAYIVTTVAGHPVPSTDR